MLRVQYTSEFLKGVLHIHLSKILAEFTLKLINGNSLEALLGCDF